MDEKDDVSFYLTAEMAEPWALSDREKAEVVLWGGAAFVPALAALLMPAAASVAAGLPALELALVKLAGPLMAVGFGNNSFVYRSLLRWRHVLKCIKPQHVWLGRLSRQQQTLVARTMVSEVNEIVRLLRGTKFDGVIVELKHGGASRMYQRIATGMRFDQLSGNAKERARAEFRELMALIRQVWGQSKRTSGMKLELDLKINDGIFYNVSGRIVSAFDPINPCRWVR